MIPVPQTPELSTPSRAERAAPGFTLVELLVVISILAVLVAIVVPNFTASRRKPFDLAAMKCAEVILQSATLYKAEHGGTLPSVPYSPDALGGDVEESCRGIRVLPYVPPTSKDGSEYQITSTDSTGRPGFFVSSPKGSGFYATHADDASCGPHGCQLKYLPWSAYGLP